MLLLDVTDDGPGAQVGISRGAILLEVAGVSVNDTKQLVDVLQQHAGEAVQVRYQFGDRERMVLVRLGDGDEVPLLGVVPEATGPRLGILGEARFDHDLNLAHRQTQGALVLEVSGDSPAERAGLAEGDIITAVDGERVGGGSERRGRGRVAEPQRSLGELIKAYGPGDLVELQVTRKEENLSLPATLATRPDGSTAAYLGVQYRQANTTIYRLEGFRGQLEDDEGLRRRMEERWRDWVPGVPVPGRFIERQVLPI